jgi:uncharacterized membrane protein YphA (DoxX/SURF4 family)
MVLKKISKLMTHPSFITSLRIALGLVFILASLDKIRNSEEFAANIANYRLVPYQLINFVAITLPWLEVVTGSFLVMGIWIRANAWIVSIMLSAFAIAILQALLRNLDISCGCFSTDPADHRMTRWTFYLNLIWLSWGISVAFLDQGRHAPFKIFSRIRNRKEGNR